MIAQERRAAALREWLLAILRFAVTRDQTDLAAVRSMAYALDRLGSHPDTTSFTFFATSSRAFCRAIAEQDDPHRATILRRELARIDDPRLRRTLEAAIEVTPDVVPKVKKKRDNSSLWKGLSPAR